MTLWIRFVGFALLATACAVPSARAQADQSALSRSSASVVTLGTPGAVLDIVEGDLRGRDCLTVVRGLDSLGLDGINLRETCPGRVNVATIRATRAGPGRVRVTTESAFRMADPPEFTNLPTVAWGALSKARVPAVIEPASGDGAALCQSIDERLVEEAKRLTAAADSTRPGAEVQADEVPPELVRGFDAFVHTIRYPGEALRANAQGRTYVRFVVDERGRPTCAEVVVALHPALNAEALRAVRAARFRPGTQNGRPVPILMTLPVTFRLR